MSADLTGRIGPSGDAADPAVLLRYLEGRSPAAEREAVEHWCAASAANRATLVRLQRAWDVAGELPPAGLDLDALWDRIRRRVDGVAAPAAAAAQHTGRAPAAVGRAHLHAAGPAAMGPAPLYAGTAPAAALPSWRRRGRLALRVALAAAAGAVLVANLDEARSKLEAVLHPAVRTYATRPGEIARMVLADGSKVVLSGASTLGVPPGYGRRSRELHLDGGAYFEVVHDPAKPFRVRTSRMTVEDRGTRFAILAYSHDPDERVAVVEGSVAVAASDTAAPVILRSRDVASVSSTGAISATRNASIDRYLSWMDGTLRFDQDDVASAAKAIERQFGLEVRVADPALAQRRFTGSVRAATLYDDLRALALLLDASYERAGRSVTFSSKRAPRRRRGTPGGRGSRAEHRPSATPATGT